MKKGLIIFLAALALAVMAAPAFADNPEIKAIYMTGTDELSDMPGTDHLLANEIGYEDYPWLYLKLEQGIASVTGHWYYDIAGDGSNEEANLAFSLPILTQTTADWKVITGTDKQGNTTYNTFWLTRLDWDTVKVASTKWWEVQDILAYDINNILLNEGADKSAHYKVGPEGGTTPVPEPISSALFLLGAGAFGLKIARKKKA